MPKQGRFRTASIAASLLAVLLCALLVSAAAGSGSQAPTARVAKSVRVVERSFQLTRPDQKERLTVGCPGHSMPLGGGMSSYPPPGAGGEGVYPRSYERLGVQRGWHVTAVLFDPTPRRTQGRDVTLQVACGPKIGHVTPPHTTKFVKPGRTKTAIATCPGRRHLFSGGFQRTNFTSQGGDYVIESRAISDEVLAGWSRTRSAASAGRSPRSPTARAASGPLLIRGLEVDVSLGTGLGTATTPTCPPGQRMTAGGFSSNGSTSVFLTNGMLNVDGTWSASGFNWGSGASLTAYGYCLRA